MSYDYDYLNPVNGTVPSTVLFELYSAIRERSIMWTLNGWANTEILDSVYTEADFVHPIQGLTYVYQGIISLAYMYADTSFVSSAPNVNAPPGNLGVELHESFFRYKAYAHSDQIDTVCTNDDLYTKLRNVSGIDPVFMRLFNEIGPNEPLEFRFKNPHVLGGVLMSTDILREIYIILNTCFTHCLYMGDYQRNRFRNMLLRYDNTFNPTYTGRLVPAAPSLDNTLFYGDNTRTAWRARGFASAEPCWPTTSPIDGLDCAFEAATDDITLTGSTQTTVHLDTYASHFYQEGTSSSGPTRYHGTYDFFIHAAISVRKVTKNSENTIINNPDVEIWQLWKNPNWDNIDPAINYEGMPLQNATGTNLPQNWDTFHLMDKVYESVDGYDGWSSAYPRMDQINSTTWDRNFGSQQELYWRGDLWTMVARVEVYKPNLISYYADDV